MKLGTSLRFLYPTGPHTYERFKEVLATLPPGGFIERPMGAFETDVQAAQVLEVAAAAHAAGLDGLLFGDSHAHGMEGVHFYTRPRTPMPSPRYQPSRGSWP